MTYLLSLKSHGPSQLKTQRARGRMLIVQILWALILKKATIIICCTDFLDVLSPCPALAGGFL